MEEFEKLLYHITEIRLLSFRLASIERVAAISFIDDVSIKENISHWLQQSHDSKIAILCNLNIPNCYGFLTMQQTALA